MTALEDRIRRIEGVADLTLELGDSGLEGIRVRVQPGVDESKVLEEIRKVLVAYGLSSRSVPRLDPSMLRPVHPTEVDEPGAPTVSVLPDPVGLRAEVAIGDRRETATAEATPDGAARAVAEALARLSGEEPPDECHARRVTVGRVPVVVVVVRRADQVQAGAGVVTGDLAQALLDAVSMAMGRG